MIVWEPLKIDQKPCPHCGVIIKACPEPCGEWDCAYHTHLGKDCASMHGKLIEKNQPNGKGKTMSLFFTVGMTCPIREAIETNPDYTGEAIQRKTRHEKNCQKCKADLEKLYQSGFLTRNN